VETNPDISLPSLFDSANLTDAVDKSLTTFLATSVHTPSHEIPWWDGSVYIVDAVHMIHDATGLSYALSIASVTVVGRLLMVPIGIWHLRNNPYEPTVVDLRKKFDQAHEPVQKARYKAEFMALRDSFPRINRFAMPAASFGTTVFMWFGLRRMTTLYPEEMAAGGMAWFTDLTQPDPFLFLPLMSSVLLFAMRELGADEMGRPRGKIKNKVLDYSIKGFQGLLVIVWFVLPASIMCFWIPNSTISCLQSVIFSQPAVIKALGFGHAGKMATFEEQPIVYDPDLVEKRKANVQQSTTDEVAATAPIRIKKGVKKQSRRRK
jgi:YidC/Oxa1 family membrane protein insertase